MNDLASENGTTWAAPRIWRTLSVLLSVAAAAAIASTARTFSATVDEPAHLAAGMQWLSTGEYTYDLQHPPLGRIAVAAGPFARGERSTGAAAIYDEGAAILGSGAHFVETLASARRGVLLFFVLLVGATWLWARRLLGELGAAVATLLLVTNPNVLAHAGLATTDVACAATTVMALYAALAWAEAPRTLRALLLGVAMAAAIGSRLSSIAFVGAPIAACYLLRGWAERRWGFRSPGRPGVLPQFALAMAAALALIVALYRFDPRPFIAGVQTFLLHGASGHPTFLLGTPSNRGWWYYYPIALLVKTPLPLLLLAFVGGVAAVRRLRDARDWLAAAPLVCALTIIAVSLTVKVDLGIRLVVPVYPLLAIVAAQGALELLRQTQIARAATGALLAASVSVAIRAHPDHLAYFNPLAGQHPERVLVDSNLDWGQDLYRLRDTLAARGIRDSVRIAYFGTMSPAASGVPNSRVLGLHERTPGWIAASETYLAGEWVGGAYAWLLAYEPVARIGPGMRLWHIPADAPPPFVTRDSSRR